MSFIDEHSDLIKAWLEKNQTEAPPASDEGKAYHQIITNSRRLQVPAELDQEAAWQQLHATITGANKKSRAGRVVQLHRNWLVGIAASLVLLIIGTWYITQMGNSLVQVATANATTKIVTLPDGSAVTLAAASSLTYQPKQWANERKVNLQGEAFFEVIPGSSFTVVSQQGSTEVKGTSFNIYARGNDYEVACFTGKVEVSTQAQKFVLVRGNQVAYDGSTGSTYQQAFDPTAATWRSGTIYYESTPIQKVLQELERQYDVTVSWPQDKEMNHIYGGHLPLDDLEYAMAVVSGPFGFDYEIKNKKVIIK